MFQATAAGAAGVNFHGGVHNRRASDDKAYTPIARSGDRYRATPLSMLMFAQAARGALVPARPNSERLEAARIGRKVIRVDVELLGKLRQCPIAPLTAASATFDLKAGV
jgi:hypothetical protein